jgi:uncharacterized protein (DUF305 family)
MKRAAHATGRKKCLAIASLATCVALVAARPYESPFLAECHEAMSRMMSAMHAAPHRDADHDFAALMIAHHEGAIAMAKAELRHGKNVQLRRLAQEMIITQQQEIAVMRMAASDDSTENKKGDVR